MTLDSQWKTYRDACYPDGLPVNQETEVRQAWFAGCLVVLKLAVDGSVDMPEEKAFQYIGDLIREAQTVCELRMHEMKGRD